MYLHEPHFKCSVSIRGISITIETSKKDISLNKEDEETYTDEV